MPSTLFALIDRTILSEESIQLTISRGPGRTLIVVMQPLLKPTAEHLEDDVESIRAALAGPLYLALPAVELDARFDDLVGTYAAARSELNTNFESLMLAIVEANKAAKTQTTRAQRRTTSTSRPVTPPQPSAHASANLADAGPSGATDSKPGVKSPPPPRPSTAKQESNQISLLGENT